MNMKRYKYIIAFVLAFMALPMMAQDYMNIFFKNGDFRKFYMKNITEIVATKVDAEGVEHEDYSYQQITTIYDKYIYKLEDVDSITFTKIDEEKAEHNFVTAMPQVFSAIGDCETIADVEKKIDQIKNTEGVVDAWSDGHELFVAIDKDEVYSFHFKHNAPYKRNKSRDLAAQIRTMKSQLEGIKKQDGTPLKVVIANQIDKNENEDFVEVKQSYLLPLYDFFHDCGIDVHYEPNPDVDFFYNKSDNPNHLNFYDYDIVLLATHGSNHPYVLNTPYKPIDCHGFVTSEDILILEKKTPPLWWNDYYNIFKEWRDKTSYHNVTDINIAFSFIKEVRDGKEVWVAHPKLSEYFFRDIAKGKFNNSNSFFFNFACHSLEGDNKQQSNTFANILFEKRNLGIYAGYTDSDSFSHVASSDFFHSMLSGYSVGKSYEGLKIWCKKETIDNVESDVENFLKYFDQKDLDDIRKGVGEWKPEGAELKILDKSGSMPSDFFLFPTITTESDEEIVNKEFSSNNFVTIKGAVTYFGDSDLVAGFNYATNSLRLKENIKAVKGNDLESENGNYQFKAKLINLEPEKTYYYCAYTFDGKYYNYGDTCSFTTPKITPAIIEDLHIDAASIELIVGESKTITITSGNGDYSVQSSNENVATASVNGTTVTVKAISTGSKVVITVIDSKSGQTATVYVTVTEAVTPIDENSEDVIDLGLPSGMLWASCNLGATKSEEIGEYYAWGEISPNWYDASGQYSMDISHSGMGLRWDMTKYCTKEKYGTVDNKISLDLKDDVVHVVLKGRYRMPSWQDYEELITNCTAEWTALNGVNGCQFKGPNGKTIFFPATGVWMYGRLESLDSYCNYWSRSLYTKLPYKASILCVFDESVWGGGDPVCVHREERYKCKPIRAVMLPKGSPSNLVDFALSGNVNPIIGLGEKCKLNVVSGNGSYTSSSKHPSIANVSVNNNVIEITGQNPGTTIIYITDKCSGQDIMVTVTVTPKTETPASAVDLGLPSGTKWASYNLGATRPEDYGGYYAWGELEKKDSYSWNTYLHCDGEDYSCYELPNDISGTVYDIVKMKWGGSWRMPTVDDFYELSDNCQIKWVSRSGAKGCLVTGPNGNSIFLPASGCVDEETKKNFNEYGFYWTPCLIDSNTDYGKSFGGFLDEGGIGGVIGDRYAGYSIRPVIK